MLRLGTVTVNVMPPHEPARQGLGRAAGGLKRSAHVEGAPTAHTREQGLPPCAQAGMLGRAAARLVTRRHPCLPCPSYLGLEAGAAVGATPLLRPAGTTSRGTKESRAWGRAGAWCHAPSKHRTKALLKGGRRDPRQAGGELKARQACTGGGGEDGQLRAAQEPRMAAPLRDRCEEETRAGAATQPLPAHLS